MDGESALMRSLVEQIQEAAVLFWQIGLLSVYNLWNECDKFLILVLLHNLAGG